MNINGKEYLTNNEARKQCNYIFDDNLSGVNRPDCELTPRSWTAAAVANHAIHFSRYSTGLSPLR